MYVHVHSFLLKCIKIKNKLIICKNHIKNSRISDAEKIQRIQIIAYLIIKTVKHLIFYEI